MSLAVKKYANALLEIAVEENCLDEVYGQFKIFNGELCENSQLEKLLVMDIIPSTQKRAILKDFLAQCNPLFANFIKIIIDKDREEELKLMYLEFNELYKQEKNIIEATAVTAIELSEAEVEDMKNKLAEKYNKTVILENKIDESILGGVVLYIGDSVVDASLKAKLDGLRNTMKQIKLS